MIKKTKLLLYICLAMFLLNSCTEEKEYLENNNRDFKIETKSFKELESNPLFNRTFNKFKKNKQKSNASRSALEDEYNFTIDPSRIKVLTYDDKVSYNFLINKDNPEVGKFENLVIEVRNSDDMKAYLMKYSQATNTLISVNGKPDVTLLDVKNESTEARVLQYCFTVYTKYCNKTGTCDGVTFTGQHLANTSCCDDPDFFVYVPGKDCVTITIPSFADFPITISDWAYLGGNNNNNNENTTSDPENINGTTSTEEVGAVPVTEDEEIQNIINTPCEELKKMTSNVNIKNTYDGPDGLNSKTNEPKEYGNAFSRSGSTDSTVPVPNSISKPESLRLTDYLGGNYYGANHTHPPRILGYHPMFSNEDINYLYKVARKNTSIPKDYSIFVLTLTVPEGAYAIKIENWSKFSNFRGSNEFIDIMTTLEDNYNRLPTSEYIDKYERIFLKMLKDNDAGIGLYKAESDFSNWNKLSLNPINSSNPIISTPCK